MGRKGDGKQRRQPQRLGDLTPSPPPPPAPSSARIQSSSGGSTHTLSVKKQIALVSRFRAAEKRQAAAKSGGPVRTSFRKQEKNNTRAGMGDEEIIDVGDVNWHQLPTLFIDGYNVVNAWPRLKKRFAKGELAMCREMLMDDVATFTIQRYETTVVWDANGASDNFGKDKEEVYAGGLVRVVYASQSADEYIEVETRRLRAEGVSVWAATNDNAIKTTCSVHGATVVSANWLVTELKASRNTQGALVADFNKQQDLAAGRAATLWDALDPSLRDELDGQLEQARYKGLSRKQREVMEAMRESGGEEGGAAKRRKQQLEAQRLRRRAGGKRGGGGGRGGSVGASTSE